MKLHTETNDMPFRAKVNPLCSRQDTIFTFLLILYGLFHVVQQNQAHQPVSKEFRHG